MKIAFVDFETTGLRADWHEVIEIGCVIFDTKDFKIIETMSVKVRPVYPQRIDPMAQAVNGYLERNWVSAPGAHETWEKFAKITKGCVFAAHNAIFDWSFMEQVIKQQPNIEFSFDRRKLCTISMAYARLPNTKTADLSLKGVCRALGIPPEPKIHEALNGAMKGYEVFKELMQNV